jgi:hypothetical protein
MCSLFDYSYQVTQRSHPLHQIDPSLSLIRWEMTGLDDEVREIWKREAMPD